MNGYSYANLFSGTFGVLLAAFLLLWGIMLLLLPFMVYAVKTWTMKSYHQLQEINQQLAELRKNQIKGKELPVAEASAGSSAGAGPSGEQLS